MSEREDEAQARVRGVVEDLKAIHLRLEEVAARLPISARETMMLLGEEEPDVTTELRSTIECVLADQLGPAIHDLARAASYRPKGSEEG